MTKKFYSLIDSLIFPVSGTIHHEIVAEERGLKDMALCKKYSLRQLSAGNCTIKLNLGGQVYSYLLALN